MLLMLIRPSDREGEKKTLAKEGAHRLLRVRREAGKQLVGIKACCLNQLPRRTDYPLRHVSLQGLRFERLRDKSETARRLGHDGWVLPRNCN